MTTTWINPRLEVPFSDVDVLVVNDCNRMFVCQYNQSTYTWTMKNDSVEGVNIAIAINNVKYWQYVPDLPI
jgi:hypothetical protein